MKAITEVKGAPAPVGAYSPAVVANGMVYCSGQIALDPDKGVLIEGGIEEQTTRVMENLSAVLESAGTSFKKAVMVSIFLADIEDASSANAIYGKYVNEECAPARQTFAIKALPLGALVEISCIAVC